MIVIFIPWASSRKKTRGVVNYIRIGYRLNVFFFTQMMLGTTHLHKIFKIKIKENEFSIENIIEGCSNQVFGISEERKTIAVEKLWLYLSKFCFFITDDFNLKFKSGKTILIKGQNWEELNKNVQQTKKKDTNFVAESENQFIKYI